MKLPFKDKDIITEKMKIGRVPVLVLCPAKIPPIPVAVLWIHGGGYFLGMKEMAYMGRAADLVKHFGVTVISPGYRLAFRKPYPAAVKDCWQVLKYMDAHRAKLGAARIMIGGESAGGGLAAALCMIARDKGIHVSFQMPLYPMISNLDTPSSRNNHGRVWNTRRNHLGWRLYLRGRATERVSPYAAPALAEDFAGLPPCYTFVGDGEPFCWETLKYVSELRRAGVLADADVYHTDMHAFDMLRPRDELSRRAVRVFEQRFRYALEHYD